MSFESFCKKCKPQTHCCIFNHDDGFTFVSISDAKHISAETGREFNSFLDYSPLSVQVLKSLKKDDPMYEGALRATQLDSQNRILRLKKKQDGTCVFLTSDRKCSIYNSRPNICRIYPFWGMRLLSGDIKIISHDAWPRCPIVVSLQKKYDDVEEALSDADKKSIRATFVSIEKEAVAYNRDITAFIKLL